MIRQDENFYRGIEPYRIRLIETAPRDEDGGEINTGKLRFHAQARPFDKNIGMGFFGAKLLDPDQFLEIRIILAVYLFHRLPACTFFILLTKDEKVNTPVLSCHYPRICARFPDGSDGGEMCYFNAFFEVSHSDVNPEGSFTAMSASTLRSSRMPDFLRPFMNLL